jgi:anti-anti-sigma factor
MWVIAGSAGTDPVRARNEPSGADIVVLATETPRRVLRAVEQHPSTLAKIEPDLIRSGLAIRGQSRAGVARLQFDGHLGVAAEPLIQVWLQQAELASRSEVLFDLRGLRSIDEAGFLICLRSWGHAKLHGLRLRLVNCGEDVRRLLDATRTGELFGAPVGTDRRGRALESASASWSPILIPQVTHDQ